MLFLFSGHLVYKAVQFMTGLIALSKAAALDGSLIAIAVIAIVAAYYARRVRTISVASAAIAGIAIFLLLSGEFILPLLGGNRTAVIAFSAAIGFIVYLLSRIPIYLRWFRRHRYSGERPAPPFGREWCRWVIAFLL